MTSPRLNYGKAPEGAVYVSVYCDGHATDRGPSHHERPWRIATFELDHEASLVAGRPFWSSGTGHTYTTADGRILTLGTASTKTYLVGDQPVTREEARNDPPGLRSNEQLRCRTCGLALRVRRETLDAALTRLHEIGVAEISLVGLRANLNR